MTDDALGAAIVAMQRLRNHVKAAHGQVMVVDVEDVRAVLAVLTAPDPDEHGKEPLDE